MLDKKHKMLETGNGHPPPNPKPIQQLRTLTTLETRNQSQWCWDAPRPQQNPSEGIPPWGLERLGSSFHPPPTPYLMRLDVGLRPQMPQKAEGKRMLPPMSVPKPSGEPPAPMRAPSPPEEPPGVLEDFHGFRVWPKRGLLQS